MTEHNRIEVEIVGSEMEYFCVFAAALQLVTSKLPGRDARGKVGASQSFTINTGADWGTKNADGTMQWGEREILGKLHDCIGRKVKSFKEIENLQWMIEFDDSAAFTLREPEVNRTNYFTIQTKNWPNDGDSGIYIIG